MKGRAAYDRWRLPALCGALLTLLAVPLWAGEIPSPGVRRAVLAGSWYPANPESLSRQIRGFLSRAKNPRMEGTLKALVVPHAGYVYSGAVAAHAYALLQGRRYDRIILVGPCHRASFQGVSVNLHSGYETPLGMVPVDLEAAGTLLDSGPLFRYVPRAHAQEHSLEIQVPFLQTVMKDFRIVPVLMGRQDPRICAELSRALGRYLADHPRTLLVASSDLSHFHTDAQARILDERFIRRVREIDPQGLLEDLASGRCEACGGGPVAVILSTAAGAGADRCAILRYANSADVTGDRSRVVGYLAAALFKSSDRDQRPR
ncbi:MAG: AmmeMemoRadiSam system protein B [Deltaproteobacteria bacterium]|nr:AmmeMemoRadiSam system protein B [Deltaproteobacteria bacterium]